MSQTTLTRALSVVDEVSKHPDGMRFSRIKTFLGNPSPTTVTKILRELSAMDVLAKNSGGAYVLGVKTYFWGKAAATRHGMMQTIREEMKQLNEELNVSINLLTCSGGTVFCLESFMAPQSPSMWRGGQSLDLELPVIGSIFFYPADQLEESRFLASELEKHGEAIPLARVEQMIKESWDSGLQDDFALFYPGARRFAVPIRENNHIVMVLGLGILEARLSKPGLLETILDRLMAVKVRIEEEISS